MPHPGAAEECLPSHNGWTGTRIPCTDCYVLQVANHWGCTPVGAATVNDGSTNMPTPQFEPPAPKLGDDPNILVGYIISAILGLVGSLALVMFVYGGITWMTAGGARERLQRGKDILIWASMGLIVIFASYAIIRYVLQSALGVG